MAMVKYILHKGQPFSEEEIEELETLRNMKDEDIDLSDIPEITPEQAKQFKRVNEGQKPTSKQIERIRALENRPIVYDEDCPKLTEEELKQFKRVNPIRKAAN